MELEKPDFTDFLNLLANNFKAKVTNLQFTLNPAYGIGYFWAEKLPSGITILVSDTCLKEDLAVELSGKNDGFFILQFNEEAMCETEISVKTKRNNIEFDSSVKLSHTSLPQVFVFPQVKTLRSVKFFFNENNLASLLGQETFEKVVNNCFPRDMMSATLEPIATEYRVMLDDLWTDKINHPLKLNYIQNRVFLLLEKYIIKLLYRSDYKGKKVKQNSDDTLRLMKVEAILVKNFAVTPPVIGELARICAMSSTKLKNDFKALYGLPIYKYFQKNRMLKAKSLLALGKYTIKEVGELVGYCNQSHFASTFKKRFGFLPSEITSRDDVLKYDS